MLTPEGPPRASREEDLPGFTTSSSTTFRSSPSPRAFSRLSVKNLLIHLLLFTLILTPAEGCLPSWFRQQRHSVAEGSGAGQAEEFRGDLRLQRVQKVGTPYTSPEPDDTEDGSGEYEDEEEEEDDSHLSELYGTASPIAHDQMLVDAKKAFEETECPGWCFMGGTCQVEVDPVSYKFIGKQCMCPPNYWGKRCDHHYIKRLYAPVRGQVHVERSAVPALAFFLIMLVVTVGLAIYSYRKITKRSDHSVWSSSSPSTLDDQQGHLRRNRAIYVGRTPFSQRLHPRHSAKPPTPASGPLLLQGGHLALPHTTVSPPFATQSVSPVERGGAQVHFKEQRIPKLEDSSRQREASNPSPHRLAFDCSPGASPTEPPIHL